MHGYRENPHCRAFVVDCYEPGLLPARGQHHLAHHPVDRCPVPESEREAFMQLSPEAQQRLLETFTHSHGAERPLHEILDNPHRPSFITRCPRCGGRIGRDCSCYRARSTRPNPWFSPPAMQYVARFTNPPTREVHPLAYEMRDRYRDDMQAGHSDAAEYWRGQAAAYFTGNNPPRRRPKCATCSKPFSKRTEPYPSITKRGRHVCLDCFEREASEARMAALEDYESHYDPHENYEAYANPPCAACGRKECPCGCEGDPELCDCSPSSRQNPWFSPPAMQYVARFTGALANPGPDIKLSKTAEAKYHHLTVVDPKTHPKSRYSGYRVTPWRGSTPGVLVRWGLRKTPGPRGGRTELLAFLLPADQFTLSQAKSWAQDHGGHEVYKIRASRKTPAKKKAAPKKKRASKKRASTRKKRKRAG